MSGEEARDGRTLRRERNVGAVLDAFAAMVDAGDADPSLDEVARRSGVSLRSILRYFPDRDHLVLAAFEQRFAQSLAWRAAGAGESTGQRVRSFVRHCLSAHADMAASERVALSASRGIPGLARVLEDRRVACRGLVRTHFAAELEAMTVENGRDAVVAVGLLCQPESLDAMLYDDELSEPQVARVLNGAVLALLNARPDAV